jgi:hypothetical protein
MMKTNVFSGTLAVLLTAACLPYSLRAANPASSSEQYVARKGLTWMVKQGVTNRLEKPVKLAATVQLETNAVFRVGQGKERTLREGQILLPDGFLLGTDGSLAPVFDHYVMKRGDFWVCRDGVESRVAVLVGLPSGDRIDPAGWIRRPNGSSTRLIDGELLSLSGQPLPSWDVVSKLDGHLRIQKEGALVAVPSGRSLMMNDGTKILTDGTLVSSSGTARALSMGEYVLLPGIRRVR